MASLPRSGMGMINVAVHRCPADLSGGYRAVGVGAIQRSPH